MSRGPRSTNTLVTLLTFCLLSLKQTLQQSLAPSSLLSFAFEKAKLFRSLDTSGPVVTVSDILVTNGLTVDYQRFSNDGDLIVRSLFLADMALPGLKSIKCHFSLPPLLYSLL